MKSKLSELTPLDNLSCGFLVGGYRTSAVVRNNEFNAACDMRVIGVLDPQAYDTRAHNACESAGIVFYSIKRLPSNWHPPRISAHPVGRKI